MQNLNNILLQPKTQKMMNNKKVAPITIVANEASAISMVGDTYQILLSGEQTGGNMAIMNFMIPPGGGPGPHAHAEIQESFYIIDGEIEVKSEAGTYVAKKGSFVSIPKGGMVHQFKNKGKQTAHVLCVVVPAGLDSMFVEGGRPVAAGSFLPPPEMTPEYVEKLQKAAVKYGQQLFPPDYLDK